MLEIRSYDQYQAVMEEIDRLMDAEANTPKARRLETLASAAEEFEKKHYPIDPPTEEEMEEFRRAEMRS